MTIDYDTNEDVDTDDEKPKKGRKSSAQKQIEIHQHALSDFDRIQSTLRDERKQCLQDRRFYSIAGAQWEGALGEQFANKPRLEVNKIRRSVTDIITQYRANRIDAAFIAKDGATDDVLPETCASLHRSDEQDSGAEEAYDNCFEEGVGGGMGAWRLRAEYEDEADEDNDHQRIRFEPIYDADSSVFFDLDAKRQDKSDARHCFVVFSMTRTQYMREYPEDDPATWPKSVYDNQFDWLTPDVVYLAEYYCVEEEKIKVYFFRGLNGEQITMNEDDLDAETLADMEARGFSEYKTKDVKKRRIHKYLLNGNKILKDCGRIAGDQIPIVVFYAQRWFIDNIERCAGHVRYSKDAQRIKNMEISKLAEIAAYSPIEKPIFTPEQVEGHEMRWAQDNVKNFPYQLVNPATDASGAPLPSGPQGYTKSPAIPQALAALLELTEMDMKDILGNPQEVEMAKSHVPGKAVENLQRNVDKNAQIYITNMAKARQWSAKVWLGMAREIYVEEGRKMKGIGERGNPTQVVLKQPWVDQNQMLTTRNDLSRAKFDVVVTTGPSSDSKRAAALNSLTGIMGYVEDPETKMVLANTAIMNMEGEGVPDLREWARKKLVRMGAVKPTEEEAKELAEEAKNAQPSPNDQYLLAAAEAEKAKAQKTAADTTLATAQVDKTKAETLKTVADVQLSAGEAELRKMETLAGIDLERAKAQVGAAESLHGMLTQPAKTSPGAPK